MTLKTMTAVSAIAVLSACGGGSTSSVSLEELIARGTAFEGTVAPLNVDELPLAPDSALQSTGSANFTGIAVYARESATDDEVTDFAAIGSATVSVDFATGVAAGSARDFFQIDNDDIEEIEDITGTSVAGSVTYDLLRGADEDNFYEGNASGTLTATDGTVYTFDLPAAGGLVGDEAQGFAVEAFEEDGLDGFGVLALRD